MQKLLALVALVATLAMPASAVFAAVGDLVPDDDTVQIAAMVNVDPLDLQGAVNTTRLEATAYAIAVGLLEPPRPPSLRDYAYANYATAWCIERIVNVESNGWNTTGWNPIAIGRWGEHASGLGGFLPSTWASTPSRGASIWDGYAQVDAIDWMLRAGRGREFAAVTWGRCPGY